MSKIQQLPGGVIAVYLDAEWRPVEDPEAAVYVEVTYPDGSIVFGVATPPPTPTPKK